MSKKKSFTGSTMTLKDFHGGSIPSDLPLPSAPGVSVRSPDRWAPSSPLVTRPGFDTHHRPRPGSSGSGSGATTRIGSGFAAAAAAAVDEKGPPFLSTPANIGRHFDEDERKPFDASAAVPRRLQPSSDPVPAPAPERSDPKPHPRASSVGHMANAWGMRKVEAVAVVDSDPVVNLSSRFAEASAVEKVTSGRWQTKVEVERESVRVGEEGRTSLAMEVGRPGSNEGRSGGLQLQEGVERPKLKLLPRTRMGDGSEVRVVVEEKQVIRVWLFVYMIM